MPNSGTTKPILVNLDAHHDVRTVMNHVVSEMVVRGYSEYEIWKVWSACRNAEDTDELCGWLGTFLPIRVRAAA
jgi:hypothetical protein